MALRLLAGMLLAVFVHTSALLVAKKQRATCPENHTGFDTNCYTDPWMDEMMAIDPMGGNKVFMDVGCNTGIDAVSFISRWGISRDSAKAWSEELTAHVGEGACQENFAPLMNDSTVNRWRPTTLDGLRTQPLKTARIVDKDPRVLCVEPMPSNVKLLNEVNAKVFGPNSPLEVIGVAASDQAGTAFFPDDGKIGREIGHLETSGGDDLVPVMVRTVDDILSGRAIEKVDVLTIDTEGFDPAVIKGAQETLRHRGVRFLVFEVHQDRPRTPWWNTTLLSVTDSLSEEHFDCYWAGNDGHLRRITGCLDEEKQSNLGRIGWSNVACVRRGDIWQDIINAYAV